MVDDDVLLGLQGGHREPEDRGEPDDDHEGEGDFAEVLAPHFSSLATANWTTEMTSMIRKRMTDIADA